MKVCALTIAGFDPSAGAGVIADCETFSRAGVFPLAAITAYTVQNSRGVYAVEPIAPKLLRQTLKKLFDDFPIHAVKTGLLPNEKIVRVVADSIPRRMPIVIDPVLASTGGKPFLSRRGQIALLQELVPRSTIVTPNLAEMDLLANSPEELLQLGAHAVLAKGGHLQQKHATDVLYLQRSITNFEAKRLSGKSVHGTGCNLSAGIAAYLALGKNLKTAIRLAKTDTWKGIKNSIQIGKGRRYFDLRSK